MSSSSIVFTNLFQCQADLDHANQQINKLESLLARSRSHIVSSSRFLETTADWEKATQLNFEIRRALRMEEKP